MLTKLSEVFPGIEFVKLADSDNIAMHCDLGYINRLEAKLDTHAFINRVMETIKDSKVYRTIAGHLEARLARQENAHIKEVEQLNNKIDRLNKEVKKLTQYKNYYDLTYKLQHKIGVD